MCVCVCRRHRMQAHTLDEMLGRVMADEMLVRVMACLDCVIMLVNNAILQVWSQCPLFLPFLF